MLSELGDERWLGQRVQNLRKARGWSQAELARQMSAAGYPIHQSAISKIEPVDPEQATGRRRGPDRSGRRSVSISEIKGFSKVFNIPFGELLLPEDAMRDVEAWKMYTQALRLQAEIRSHEREYAILLARLVRLARQNPGIAARIREEDERVRKDEADMRTHLLREASDEEAERLRRRFERTDKRDQDLRHTVADEILAKIAEASP